MKKIVFVIGVLSNGGAERVISVLAKGLSDIGYEVSIITIYGDKNDYLFDERINIVPIIHKDKNKIQRILGKLIRIRKTIKRLDPDVIISFVAIINIYTILASAFLGKKLIISERNDPYQNPENRYIRIIRNFLYKFVDCIVFQTEDAKNYFSSFIKSKGVIISNPIKADLPSWKGSRADKTIITACRLSKQKNLPMLINAFACLLKEFPDYKLKIFGIGNLRDDLLKQIDSLGIKDCVELPGFSNNIHEEMVKASLFVISSDYEGISNSMLEALAIGVPVISTDSPIGGAKMFIENYKNGILIKVRDTEGLVEAMKEILTNPSLANNLSRESRKIKEVLSQDKIIKKWVDIIES